MYRLELRARPRCQRHLDLFKCEVWGRALRFFRDGVSATPGRKPLVLDRTTVALSFWLERDEFGDANRKVQFDREESFTGVGLCVFEHCADAARKGNARPEIRNPFIAKKQGRTDLFSLRSAIVESVRPSVYD